MRYWRSGLHRAVQRREERLLFDHQRELAKLFGYADQHRENLAVEQLMQGFFRAASSACAASPSGCCSIGRNGSLPSPRRERIRFGGRLRSAPRTPCASGSAPDRREHGRCNAGLPSAGVDRGGQGLAPELAATIQQAVCGYAPEAERDDCVGAFRAILKQPLRAARVLRVMSELDLLGRLIPAFERVTGEHAVRHVPCLHR